MTYIVELARLDTTRSVKYDIVEGADRISVTDSGVLLLHPAIDADAIAAYQPGEWAKVHKDAVVRRADSEKIYQLLSVASFNKEEK
ncbi:hypothetical protein [Rhodococcus sp. IEGM 1379]|uniref:hypothetical protein n=1 Tax=Rhodococcus sp. IEGM 1379 TaxID=3047086 RepID=UPI0024B86EE4|nr:hypothetical protein [Rhodococcus sp. IEGM 1379]MDI9917867.1 hypothetical protein [Rhodococcus sp. IEGM 1379]